MIEGGSRLAILIEMFIQAVSLSFWKPFLPVNRFSLSTTELARHPVNVMFAICFVTLACSEVLVPLV